MSYNVDAQPGEEFNGPFASWADVKQRFGAKGNGRDDDTRALQRALDEIGPNLKGAPSKATFMVLYLPAGTYCISSTLVLRGKIAVGIIGEDPERTTLKWTGKDNDTMLWANGSAYYKISRIGWDPGGRKGIEALGIHWRNMWRDAGSQSFASLNIEVSDNIFHSGLLYGISGGTTSADGTSANDSELSIRRCIFRNCTFGIGIKGHNALDYWIWDCRFLQCAMGVSCTMGNYHIYRCYFSRSLVSDVHNNNGYYNSIRGSYSIYSNDLSSDEGGSSNPFKRIFQDNQVIAPRQVAIRHNHLGRITLLGNTFTAATNAAEKFSVYNRSWFPCMYEALSLNNVYPAADAVRLDVNERRLYTAGDKVDPRVSYDTMAFLKTLDPMPALVRRPVLEVPENADAGVIQGILNRAAAMKGQRPVVHFGPGSYTVDRTLKIAAGADMQLTGDGWLYGTVIQQKDTMTFRRAPLLQVEGPSYITIRDMQWGSAWMPHQYAAVVFLNTDQPAAEVHIDQVYSPGSDTSLFVRGMNNLYVQKDNSFFSTGNYIDGGSRAGKGTARVSCFGGQFVGVAVRHQARFTAKDCWWEGDTRIPLDLSGEGAITIDGGMIAPARADSQTTIRINKFDGTINLMNMYLQGGISPAPDNPRLRLLVWNIHSYYKMGVLDFLRGGASYKAAFLGLTAQCFRPQDPACRAIICIGDRLVNVAQAEPFLEEQTRQTREARPVRYRQLSPGVSNVYLSRVSLGKAGRGLVFLAGKKDPL